VILRIYEEKWTRFPGSRPILFLFFWQCAILLNASSNYTLWPVIWTLFHMP